MLHFQFKTKPKQPSWMNNSFTICAYMHTHPHKYMCVIIPSVLLLISFVKRERVINQIWNEILELKPSCVRMCVCVSSLALMHSDRQIILASSSSSFFLLHALVFLFVCIFFYLSHSVWLLCKKAAKPPRCKTQHAIQPDTYSNSPSSVKKFEALLVLRVS